MTATSYWFRRDLRQRWRSLLVLSLLVALAAGTVMTAVAGARRGATAVDRLLDQTLPATVGVALVGLAVGVPLGVALGRTIWRYVADTTPVFYVPPVAVLAVLLVVPIALVAANVLAAWPGHRAASLQVSHVLRAE